MKRAIALGVALTFVAGCSGGGINGGSLLPGMSPNVRAPGGRVTDDGRHRMLDVNVTMRIPKRHRREHAGLHPATISPATKSVGFVVNGGAAQVFNATTSSSNCKVTSSGTVCSFSVKAPPGSDSFIVTTYSATGGAGTALDRAVATIAITAGKANAPTIRLGPVVSVATDSGIGSLRYAIATANSGDTILFTIPATSKITLASSLTLNANVSIAGPGTKTTARPRRDARHPDLTSDVTVSGLQISGAGTQQIFVISPGVNAKISGLVLTDGLATTTSQPGGAIYNAGSLTLSNDGFTDNGSQVSSPYTRPHTARQPDRHREQPHRLRPHACTISTQYGGAIYNHGNIVVTGSTFASNVLQSCFGSVYSYGGAVYTDEYSTFTSSSNIYSANSAYYGGAVYVNTTYGQASFTSDQFASNAGCGTSTGCPSSGCSTLTAVCSTSYPVGYGSAIYDGDGPGVTVTSSTFSSNVAGGTTASSFGEGGAINLETGSPVITGSMFTGNKAGGGTANCSEGYGGAIYEDAGNAIELDNDTFSSNVASGDKWGYGGAVYNDADPDNGSGNKFTSNQAIGSGSPCATSAYGVGGALKAEYGITMTNSSFTSNVAKGNEDAWGGAIDSESTNSVLLSSDTFTNNSAVGTGLNSAPDSEAYGGALYLDLSTRLNADTFSGNSATAQSAVGAYAEGGAIYSTDTVISNGNTFTSNGATIPSATGTTTVYGGAVYNDSSYYSNGDKFSSNKASGRTSAYGGALYVDSTFATTNDTFGSNTVTASAGTASGGGAYLDSSASGTIAGGSFTANKSTSTGFSNLYDHGGGAIDAETSVTINGITATGNGVTGGSGGALFGDGSDVEVNNSVISGNTMSGAGDSGGGGGIYNYDDMNVTNSTVSGNSAAVNGTGSGGGGIYVYDAFTITGSTVSGNKVTGTGASSGGGGIFNNDTNALTNVTISNNRSAIDGGAFEEYGNYAVNFDNVTMYQNTATGKGGNLYNVNTSSPYVTLANTIVGGGTAGSGGGADVYNSGTLTSQGYNILQTAQVGGGTFTPATGDKIANPNLLALSNNGGSTFTNADQSTSPGKAYIPWTSASNGTCGVVADMGMDQRGYTRGKGGKCDVGAYELSGSPYAIKVRPHAKLRPDPRKPHQRHRAPRHHAPR